MRYKKSFRKSRKGRGRKRGRTKVKGTYTIPRGGIMIT